MSSSIGEPFQLYSTNTSAKKLSLNSRPVYTAYNPRFRRHATLTIQGDGIHVVDVENLHSVVSHSVGDHVSFSAPAFTRSVVEDNNIRFSVTYAVIKQAPEIIKANRERTVWIMKQTLAGLRVTKDERKSVVTPFPPVRICGVDSDTLPLLLVSKSGGISLADPEVAIKSQLEWTGGQELLDVFIFPSSSCPVFIQRDTDSTDSAVRNVVCICCQAGSNLYVRVALVGGEIAHVDTCKLPIGDEGETVEGRIAGVTCSAEGVLSFITSRGAWKSFQFSVSEPSTLHAIPLTEPLQLHAFKKRRPGISVVSLSSSLVLLATTVEGQNNISLQLWDLRYGVLLASQTMASPVADALPHLHLILGDEGQTLLSLSPSQPPSKSQGTARSTVHVIPFDQTLKSNLAAALGKSSATEEWLVPLKSDPLISVLNEDQRKLVSALRTTISKRAPQRADHEFFTWVQKHSRGDEAEPVYGHEFVKRIVNAILVTEVKAGDQHSPRILQYLLERGLVNSTMVDGTLLRRLSERGHWENVILSLRTVIDVSEDEMMSSLKFVIDAHRKRENKSSDAMDLDLSEPWIPPLETLLSACLSYDFSPVAVRLSIRKYLSDARDLVAILGVLEGWLYGGIEDEMKVALMSTVKSVAVNTESRTTVVPPYPKIITFLQTLLDASCIALLQYQPSYDLLRKTLAQIEPEIDRLDRLEQLRGVLEPFAKALVRTLREKAGCVPKESPTELKRQRKRMEQQASLGVGLYKLEELVL